MAAEQVLNATTRCDACRSRAYVVVILKRSWRLPRGGQLLFCNHCRRTNGPALEHLIANEIDESEQLADHVRDDKHVN